MHIYLWLMTIFYFRKKMKLLIICNKNNKSKELNILKSFNARMNVFFLWLRSFSNSIYLRWRPKYDRQFGQVWCTSIHSSMQHGIKQHPAQQLKAKITHMNVEFEFIIFFCHRLPHQCNNKTRNVSNQSRFSSCSCINFGQTTGTYHMSRVWTDWNNCCYLHK